MTLSGLWILARLAAVTLLAVFMTTGLGIGVPAQAQGRAGAAGDRFLDVIVVLNDGFAPGGHRANQAAAAAAARGMGVAATHTYGTALFGFSARIPEGRLTALENDPRVAYVDLDGAVSTPRPVAAAKPDCSVDSSHPSCKDSSGGDPAPTCSNMDQVVPWGISRTGADTNPNKGTGIDVYVIDTGIDNTHPDLAANLGNGHAVEFCKGGGCGELWDDDNGHGSHVAGTIGAIDDACDVVGMAPEVKLHAVKVLNNRGSGTFSGVIAGVDWVASQVNGAPVVANMSLSGGGSKGDDSCFDGVFYDGGTGGSAFYQAMCNAANAGVVFSVAAGNAGADAANSVPAAYDDAVITVSATSSADNWPSWSNYGNDAASWTANNSAPVAIAAPGVSVLSTWKNGGVNTISGTSMATPHVAGAIALHLATNPSAAGYSAFTNARAALLGSAESTVGFSNTSGRPHAEDFLDAGGL